MKDVVADAPPCCSNDGMSLASAQAAAFIVEAMESGKVWTICDTGGYPAPADVSGERAMPFWSRESRARKIIDNVTAYREFEPEQMELAEFLEKWLPGLEEDRLFVGLNWYGKRATGYNLAPAEVRARFALARPQSGRGVI